MSVNDNMSLILSQETMPEIVEETFQQTEFIPRTQLERLVSAVRDISNGLPLHLQQLQLLPYSDELKEQLVSAYSNEAQKLHRFMNKEVECLGIVVWEVLPYLKKPATPDAPLIPMPGFYQVRFLTTLEDENGNWVVLRSSSMGIATSAFFVTQNQGAWLFKKPITFRFSVTNGGAHQMVKSGESLQELKDLIKKGMERG